MATLLSLIAAGCSSAQVKGTGAPAAGAEGERDDAEDAAGSAKAAGTSAGRPDDGGFVFHVPEAGAAPMEADPFGDGCNKLDVKFDRKVPTVALVVDRSSSMSDRYDPTGSRWDVLKKALLDPTAGLVKPNETEIRFGLFLFTSTAKAPTCPWLGEVKYALGNYVAIQALYGPAQPPTPQEKGETPTGETIASVTDTLLGEADPGPKYILLATDGEPDTCPGTCQGNGCPVPDRPGWPRDPNCGHDRSLAAVQAAFKKGVKTFVLGLGNELGTEHLQALANAGAGAPVALGKQAELLQGTCALPSAQWKGSYVATATMNVRYYKPGDAAQLAADLKTILDAVRSCTFTLKGEADLTAVAMGQVKLDDRALPYGDANGWRMNSATELELRGEACRTLQTTGSHLQVAFPCRVFKPIE